MALGKYQIQWTIRIEWPDAKGFHDLTVRPYCFRPQEDLRVWLIGRLIFLRACFVVKQ